MTTTTGTHDEELFVIVLDDLIAVDNLVGDMKIVTAGIFEFEGVGVAGYIIQPGLDTVIRAQDIDAADGWKGCGGEAGGGPGRARSRVDHPREAERDGRAGTDGPQAWLILKELLH